MLNVCIGYDCKEPVSYHVLAHSIMTRASKPVSITPIYLPQLRKRGIYTRPRDPDQSTDFTYSRFLTPWMSEPGQRSIFMDCDMLCLADIYELDTIAASQYDRNVLVVKHNYIPNPANKFLDQVQTTYPCKNWSSLMVFNGHRMATKRLTPNLIDTASAMHLHRFKWCSNGLDDVGELPLEWNHLVGEYAPNPAAKLVHFTRGGPWFPDFADCEYADAWRAECASAMSPWKV